MIATEYERRVAKAALARLEETQAKVTGSVPAAEPTLRAVMTMELAAQAEELRAELAEYAALRAGSVREISVASLAELPAALVRARLAAGLSQQELARRLGVRVQVVQRDEARRYARAQIDRLLAVAAALGVTLAEPACLRVAPPDHDALLAEVLTASPSDAPTTRRGRRA